MNGFFITLRRDLLNLFENPMWLAFNIPFPIIMALLLGHLSSGSYADFINSYDYYGLTMLLFSSVMVCSTAANTFMEERIKKANLRIFSCPVGKSGVIASKVIATFIFASICQAIVALVLVLTVKVNLGYENTAYTLGLCSLFNLLSSAIGVLACCIMHSETMANQVLSFITALMSITSGIFFPIYRAGKALVLLSKASPLTLLVNTTFRIVYDSNLADFVPTALILVTASVVLTVLGVKLFRMEDYI